MGARPRYVENRRPGDDHIFDELSRHDYEALYTLKAGDIVVDAGAHAGFFTTYAAEKVGPTGHVHAFEPEADNFELLCQNTEGYPNVGCYPWALWSGTALRPLSLSHSSAEHSLVYERLGRKVQEVRCVALDSVAFDYMLERRRPVTFMKIDVEGAELQVLRGAEQTILASRPYIAIELDEKETLPVTAFLAERDYNVSVRRGSGIFLYGMP
jgi:FkbM family methyltransferase